MSNVKHTPGPWECAMGSYGKGRTPDWEIRKHEFPRPPYEGDLDNEWGVYPPAGEVGPVALVAGEHNARLISAAPNLLAAAVEVLAELNARLDAAPSSAKPVFRGIAALSDAINKATGQCD